MKDLAHAITENTMISLGVVVTLLGGSAYVTWTAFQGVANAKAIEEIRSKQTAIDVMASDIAVIKAKLENIEKSLNQ